MANDKYFYMGEWQNTIYYRDGYNGTTQEINAGLTGGGYAQSHVFADRSTGFIYALGKNELKRALLSSDLTNSSNWASIKSNFNNNISSSGTTFRRADAKNGKIAIYKGEQYKIFSLSLDNGNTWIHKDLYDFYAKNIYVDWSASDCYPQMIFGNSYLYMAGTANYKVQLTRIDSSTGEIVDCKVIGNNSSPYMLPLTASKFSIVAGGGENGQDLIWAMTLDGGYYKSVDSGETFTLMKSLHITGYNTFSPGQQKWMQIGSNLWRPFGIAADGNNVFIYTGVNEVNWLGGYNYQFPAQIHFIEYSSDGGQTWSSKQIKTISNVNNSDLGWFAMSATLSAVADKNAFFVQGTGVSGADAILHRYAFNSNKTDIIDTEITYNSAPLPALNSILIIPNNSAPTNIALSNSYIMENQPIGTTVGVLSSTDLDANNTFTYSISGTDAASFSIDGNALKSAVSFNYESKTSYSINITSTDQGGESFTKPFTISITNDILDDGFLLDSSSAVELENGMIVAAVPGNPTLVPVRYNGLQLPVGSVIRNSITGQKFLKISGGLYAFFPIEISAKSEWSWSSEGTDDWDTLQSY